MSEEKTKMIEKDFKNVLNISENASTSTEDKYLVFDVLYSQIAHEDEKITLFDIVGLKDGNEKTMKGYRYLNDLNLLDDIRSFFNVSDDIPLTRDNVKWHI